MRISDWSSDVCSSDLVARVVNDAVTRLGGIEVLINIAGIQRTTPIETLTVADMRELFEVNMIGTMVFCREALRHLPEQVGVIVNIASTAADHGNPYMSAYAASKGAVLAFSKTLRSEEHTSELQSLMRISYAVFCLKKKK